MDDEINLAQFEDLSKEERIISEYNALYKPAEYKQIFFASQSEAWEVDASFPEAYYETAKIILEGVVDGTFRESIQGVAAVFMARHYLEVALKYALFHSRWLQERNINEPSHNAHDNEIESVELKHNLSSVWSILLSELNKRNPDLRATGLDIKFVEKFVSEFHQIDKGATRFRYPSKLAVASPADRRRKSLGIDFELLLRSLKRTHDILEALDSRLIDQYGFNQDWESELNSF